MKTINEQKGFAVIFSLLIFAAIGITIASSLLVLGTGFTQTAGTEQDSEIARNLANACAELGLQKLVTTISYVGTSSVTTIGTGTCTYNISAYSSASDYVKATGISNNVVRKVQIKIATATLLIASWQEVGDFY